MKSVVLLGIIALARAEFSCPAKNGQYPDMEQCDKYWDCRNGEAIENICPDGLVYDPSKRSINRCDYPFKVDCGDRNLLQTPQPTGDCPRRNGLFNHPDPNVCNVFLDCVDGVAEEIKCMEGVQYEDQPALCKWSYLLSKETCKVSKYNFVCPKIEQGKNVTIHPLYPHRSDCQKFYVCFNGFEPRELSCTFGEVYNNAEQRCDSPVDVPGCEDWYSKYEEFEDTTEDVELELKLERKSRGKFQGKSD